MRIRTSGALGAMFALIFVIPISSISTYQLDKDGTCGHGGDIHFYRMLKILCTVEFYVTYKILCNITAVAVGRGIGEEVMEVSAIKHWLVKKIRKDGMR